MAKDKDLKDAWAQATREANLEKSEEEFKATEAELLIAYDDSAVPEAQLKRSEAADKALEDEWQHLKRIAMTQFPEGARILGLTPANRLVAVASCLGWGPTKISKASGIKLATISAWIYKRPDVKFFMDEFNLRNGAPNRDILKEKLSEMEYLAVNFAVSLLKDKDSSESMKRLKLDASKWVFALTRDKTEDSSGIIKQLLETLGTLATKQQISLSAKEEEELFKAN